MESTPSISIDSITVMANYLEVVINALWLMLIVIY